MTLKSICCSSVAVVALGLFTNTTSAQSLIGDEIDAIWDFAGGSYHEPHHFTVAHGVDLAGIWGLNNDLDVEDLSISIDASEFAGGWSPSIIWSFLDLDFGAPHLVLGSATVTSNYAGPDDYLLTTTADSVRIQFVDTVLFDNGDDLFTINLHVVPEPAAVCQLALLSLVMFAARKR